VWHSHRQRGEWPVALHGVSRKQRRLQFQRKRRLKICLSVIVIFQRQFYPVPLNDVGELNSSQLLIEWNHQHLSIHSLIFTISRSFSVPCLCSNCSVFFAWMDCDFRCHCNNLWKLLFLLLTFFFSFLSFPFFLFSFSPFFFPSKQMLDICLESIQGFQREYRSE